MQTQTLTLENLLRISTMIAEEFEQFSDIDCENIATMLKAMAEDAHDTTLVSTLDLAFMNRTAVLMDGLRRHLAPTWRGNLNRETERIVNRRHDELKQVQRERFDKILGLLDIRRAEVTASA